MTIKTDSLPSTIEQASLATGGNELLALMTADDRDLIAPWCSRCQLPRGSLLIEAGTIAEAIYFVEYGVASVIKPRRGADTTEVALIGPETVVDASVVLGDGRSPYRTFVQSERLGAINLPAARAREALDRSLTLQRLLTRAIYTQMVQVTEGLVSAAWQRLDARLARWLLMYRDRMRSNRLEVTHEFMAMMLGAQRTGVTETLHHLEGAGLIASVRGLVIVRDVAGLELLAGDGYGVPEREHTRLFHSVDRPLLESITYVE